MKNTDHSVIGIARSSPLCGAKQFLPPHSGHSRAATGQLATFVGASACDRLNPKPDGRKRSRGTPLREARVRHLCHHAPHLVEYLPFLEPTIWCAGGVHPVTLATGETTMISLGDKWVPVLLSQPETGMGYQIASVFLRDGRQYDRVTITQGAITQIDGKKEIPFKEEDIGDIRVTHERPTRS
jgi:hypothetical protein